MKKIVFSLLFVFLSIVVLSKAGVLLADEYEDLQKRIAGYQQQIDSLQKQEKSLNQQISLMDSQIKLTGLKIIETQNKIKVLTEEIKTLSAKIVRLEDSLNFISKVLLERLAEAYKSSRIDPAVLLFSSRNFSEFVLRYRYLQKIQLHDRELLLSMEKTRTSYDEQKMLKERIQEEMANLEGQLVGRKKELAMQVEDRKSLLRETKGKEVEFQRLLASALAEQETILKSMQDSILKLAGGTTVVKGQEIAILGNTGYPCCSTGAHLHFMVTTGCQHDGNGYIKNCNPVNPAGYLKNTGVAYDSNVGQMSFNGSWDWPLDNPRITQEYGMSYWARTGYYGGKPHNGIDMVNSNYVIKAPLNGVLYRNSTTCGGCNGGCCATVNFVALDHGGGLYSWYWHVK